MSGGVWSPTEMKIHIVVFQGNTYHYTLGKGWVSEFGRLLRYGTYGEAMDMLCCYHVYGNTREYGSRSRLGGGGGGGGGSVLP